MKAILAMPCTRFFYPNTLLAAESTTGESTYPEVPTFSSGQRGYICFNEKYPPKFLHSLGILFLGRSFPSFFFLYTTNNPSPRAAQRISFLYLRFFCRVRWIIVCFELAVATQILQIGSNGRKWLVAHRFADEQPSRQDIL
jgi:hypothetical protein